MSEVIYLRLHAKGNKIVHIGVTCLSSKNVSSVDDKLNLSLSMHLCINIYLAWAGKYH